VTDINKLLEEHSGIRLDIGCGESKQPGWIGMDMRALPGVDIVWDVEEYPWPLPDECVLVAMASHLVEHLDPHRGGFLNFMDEVWRVMKPEGKFAVSTPHALSRGFAQDPTHCNPCNEVTFKYFDPTDPSGLYGFYRPKPWKVEYLSWTPVANVEVVLRKLPVSDGNEEVGDG
jgi:hypothetical protein